MKDSSQKELRKTNYNCVLDYLVPLFHKPGLLGHGANLFEPLPNQSTFSYLPLFP